MAKTHPIRSINLLPPAPQPSSAAQHYHSFLLIIGGIFMVLTALTIFFKLDTVRLDLADQGKQDELEKNKAALSQYEPLMQNAAIIADRKASIEQLRAGTITYDEILTTVEQATPTQLQINKLSHRLEEGITITGIAAQQSDVSSFVEQLKGSKIFPDVLLKQTTGTDKGVTFILLAQLANQKRK